VSHEVIEKVFSVFSFLLLFLLLERGGAGIRSEGGRRGATNNRTYRWQGCEIQARQRRAHIFQGDSK